MVTAAALRSMATGGTKISNGSYNEGSTGPVSVMQKNGVIHWTSGMSIDCDGQPGSACNKTTDPYFQPNTSYNQSDGKPLNAETLPFIVVPLPSGIWNAANNGVKGGTLCTIVYKDKYVHAVVGDQGPTDRIGEASYGAAKALGIPSSPTSGGVGSGVTYIVYTGTIVKPIESAAEARRLGELKAAEWLGETKVPDTYTVRAGDTLTGISEATNVGINAIGNFNKMITPGQTLNVTAPDSNPTSPTTLREAAVKHKLQMGAAVADFLLDVNPAKAVLAREYSVLTAENVMKFGNIHPQPDTFNWGPADRLVNFAQANNQAVHGHTLLWHIEMPGWAGADDLDKHIRTIVGRYKGKVQSWDVVNELLNEDGSLRNVWYKDLVAQAFRTAHEVDPSAKLYINDFNIETNRPKSDAMYVYVKGLLAQGVPIHGVGFQCHFNTEWTPSNELLVNLKRFKALGLEVAITEFDCALKGNGTLATQATHYGNMIKAAIEGGANKFITWGFTDGSTWLSGQQPLPFNSSYEKKSAYMALLNGLNNTAPVIPPVDPNDPDAPVVTTYVAQAGDTWSSIAQKANITVDQLMVLNNIKVAVGSSYIIKSVLPSPPTDPYADGLPQVDSESPSARVLQTELKRVGYLNANVELADNYGPKTQAAVVAFHNENPQFRTTMYDPQIRSMGWAYLKGMATGSGKITVVENTSGRISDEDVLFMSTSNQTGKDFAEETIRTALTLMGLPVTDAWINGYLTMALRESSYNPNAVNTYDSNAIGEIVADGHPFQCSRGMWQCIPQTFARYHQAGTSLSIYDPVASAAASINYVRSIYGVANDGSNLASKVQQADPNRPSKGY